MICCLKMDFNWLLWVMMRRVVFVVLVCDFRRFIICLVFLLLSVEVGLLVRMRFGLLIRVWVIVVCCCLFMFSVLGSEFCLCVIFRCFSNFEIFFGVGVNFVSFLVNVRFLWMVKVFIKCVCWNIILILWFWNWFSVVFFNLLMVVLLIEIVFVSGFFNLVSKWSNVVLLFFDWFNNN